MAKYFKTGREIHLDVIFQSAFFSRRNQQSVMTSGFDQRNRAV